MLARLRLMYPSANITQPVASVVTRWDQDKYSRGSYTFLRAGGSKDDISALSEPEHAVTRPFRCVVVNFVVLQIVFFAGEATSWTRSTYADGAFSSGVREAQRVAKFLSNKPVLPPLCGDLV